MLRFSKETVKLSQITFHSEINHANIKKKTRSCDNEIFLESIYPKAKIHYKNKFIRKILS
jgi:hypothetical protein